MTTVRKNCLSKTQRLLKSSDFGRAYAKGRSGRGRFLVLWAYRHGETEISRIGVVASKRALPKAHDRNRAKRLLREAFRNNKELFEGGADYILIARRMISGVSESDVVEDLKKALKRQT